MTSILAVAITVSDRCSQGTREDISGPALADALRDAGASLIAQIVVPDDLAPLAELIHDFAQRADINLIVTTGGTGFGPRDNTPEATRSIIQKEAPGMAEAMRAAAVAANPFAMLSRGVCGIYQNTLIINLPGSPAAVRESFAVLKPVLVHAIKLLSGDTDH